MKPLVLKESLDTLKNMHEAAIADLQQAADDNSEIILQSTVDPENDDNPVSGKAVGGYIGDEKAISNELFELSYVEDYDPFDGVAVAFIDTTSFSGWGAPIGRPQDFDFVRFKIKGAGTAITSVRVQIRLYDKDGAIQYDEVLSIAIGAAEEKTIEWDLGEIFTNAADDELYFTWQTDEDSQLYGEKGSSTTFDDDVYAHSAYSTGGSQDGTVEGGLAADQRNIWVQTGIKTAASKTRNETIINDLINSYTNVIPEGLQNSWKDDIVFTSEEETFAKTDSTALQATSTFSGWGSALGAPQNFNALKFKVRGRSGEDPITAIRCIIRTGDKDGAILKDEMREVDIDSTEFIEVNWVFAEIANAGADKLYFQWFANQLADLYGITDGDLFPAADGYGQSAYATNGGQSSMTLSTSTQYLTWVRYGAGLAVAGLQPDFLSFLSSKLTGANTTENNRQNNSNWGDWNLKSYRAKFAKFLNDNGQGLTIAVIGDSWVNTEHRIYGPIREFITSEMGVKSPGYVCANTDVSNVSGATRSRSGTWTDDRTTGRGPEAAEANTTYETATLAIGNSLETTTQKYVIHYLEQPDGGVFSHAIGGASATSVETSGASEVYRTVEVVGSDTLNIAIVSAGSAGVTLFGVEIVVSDDSKATVHKLGNGGATAARYNNIPQAFWEAAMTSLAPDVAIILLGINDHAGNVGLTDFKNRIEEMVTRLRNTNQYMDVFLVGPGPSDLERNNEVLDYNDQMYAIARDNELTFVDLHKYFGLYAEVTARGLYSDGVHPNEAGGLVIGQALRKVLRIE